MQSNFTSLVRRAQIQTQQRHLEAFLNIGLKAQTQSKAIIQALVEVKYSRQAATFVQQGNLSAGHQQINNHSAPRSASRTQEIRSEQNKQFLECDDGGKTMDAEAAATATASGSYTALEAVESINRSDQRGRKGQGIAQRVPRRRVAKTT